MFKLHALLFSVLLAATGCASTPIPTKITTSPPGATLLVDGQPIGSSPSAYTFSFDATRPSHEVTCQLDGFVDNKVSLKEDSPEYRKRSVNITMLADEAFDGTVPSDAARGPVRIQVSPQVNQDYVWTHVVNDVTTRYNGLQQLDRSSGYLRSEWVTRSFHHPYRGGATVRTQFIGNLASLDPMIYSVSIKSEISFSDAANQWTTYPRIFPEDAELLNLIRQHIESIH